MKKGAGLSTISPYRLWSLLPQLETSRLPDLLMFAAVIAVFYGILAVARTWLGPFTPSVEISQSPLALPAYAGLSLLRITLAYLLSLLFAVAYGYVAAYNAKAERFMIPLLDVLQSQALARSKGPKAKAMICCWMAGGPPHIDMFDMKPDAPADYKGEFKPIKSKLPGLDVCELMPNLGKLAEEARFDGIFVLRTNAKITPLQAVLRYRDLLKVENLFLRTKAVMRTQPIFHSSDVAIRGHVFCSFLALVMPRSAPV